MGRFTSVGAEFDDFVRSSSAALLRTAFLLTNDRGQAEDLLQVSLVRTAAHWRVARHNPMSYARRVLVNLAKNRWRDMSRRPNEAQDLEGIELPQSPGDDVVVQRDALATLVASLPMAQRKVLVLRYFEDLSVAEVAVILGCGEGTVKSRTNRALSRLRELLAAQETDKAEGQKYAQRY